jgi:hypothetical protein
MILPIRLVQVQVFLNKVSNQSQVLLRHCEGALVVDFLISVVNQLSLGILDELQVGFVWGEDAQLFRHYDDAIEVSLGDDEHRSEIGNSKHHNYSELDKEMFAWVRGIPGLLRDLPFRPHLRGLWLIAFLPAIL